MAPSSSSTLSSTHLGKPALPIPIPKSSGTGEGTKDKPINYGSDKRDLFLIRTWNTHHSNFDDAAIQNHGRLSCILSCSPKKETNRPTSSRYASPLHHLTQRKPINLDVLPSKPSHPIPIYNAQKRIDDVRWDSFAYDDLVAPPRLAESPEWDYRKHGLFDGRPDPEDCEVEIEGDHEGDDGEGWDMLGHVISLGA